MSESEEFEIAKHVISCLNSTPLAVLATNDKGGIWGTPVYFTHDDKFDFYILSNSKSRHSRAIKKDREVALVVVMPPDLSGGFEVGIQIAGVAEEMSGKEIEDIYRQRILKITGNKADFFNAGGAQYIMTSGGMFIKVVPKLIMYLDRRYHGSDSRKVSIKRLVQLSRYIR
jgi:uncharacterized protein YhbP (UPF0306 family)